MASMPADGAAGGGDGAMRLLVVEDQALVALEMEAYLAAAGRRVVGVAADRAGAAALGRAERPDLALVDLRLARGDSGLDVAADLAALGVPVLFVTGNCPEDRGRGLALGCLHKPFGEAALLAAVAAAEAILKGRQPAPVPDGMHLY